MVWDVKDTAEALGVQSVGRDHSLSETMHMHTDAKVENFSHPTYKQMDDVRLFRGISTEIVRDRLGGPVALLHRELECRTKERESNE